MRLNIPVFYNTNQNVSDNKCFSPSAGKPSVFMAYLQRYPFIHVFSDWQPLSVDEISVAHDRKHVDDILSCREANGFGNHLQSVALSLPWTTGSLYHAARHAVLNKTFTISPTSGFHHATYDESMMFCTFNGLMIAAILLKSEGLVKEVGIVDFDAHFGNGTEDIIRKLDIDYVKQMSFSKEVRLDYDQWLRDLPGMLESRFSNVNLLLYQAGADPHIDDPLGRQLTTEQMYRRDKIVFEFAKKQNIPLA